MGHGSATFVGFGIRIDILAKGAIFAFQRLSAGAAAVAVTISELSSEIMRFEAAMADIERLIAISTSSMTEIAEISTEVRERLISLSTTGVFAMQELTEAMGWLMRAGYDAVAATEELSSAMELAMATGMELTEAARTRIRVMKLWEQAGYDMINLNDQLVQAEVEFMMTTEELMTALNMVGGTASQAGLSFAETATMIGYLVAQGKTASKAGTTLRAAIDVVLDPAASARQALLELGVSMAYLETLTVDERLYTIGQALQQVEDVEMRAAYAMRIFGRRGGEVQSILTLLGDQLQETSSRIDQARDSAARAAQVFKNNIAVQLTLFGQKIMASIYWLGQWLKVQNNMIIVASTLATAIGFLTLSKLLEAKATVVQFFAKIQLISTIWQEIAVTDFNIFTWIKEIAVKIQSAVVDFWKATTSKIAAIAQAIVSAETWRAIWAWVTETTKKIISTIWDYLKAAASFLVALAKKAVRKETWKNIGAQILSIAQSVIQTIVNIGLAGSFKLVAAGVKSVVTAAGPFAAIAMVIGVLIKYLIERTTVLQDVLQMFTPILNVFKQLWNALKVVFQALFEALAPLLDLLMAVLLPVLQILMIPLLIIGKVLEFLMLLLAPFLKIIGALVQAFNSLAGGAGLFGKVMEGIGKIIEKVMGWINSFLELFVGFINKIINFINRILGTEIQTISLATEEKEEETKDKGTGDEEGKTGFGQATDIDMSEYEGYEEFEQPAPTAPTTAGTGRTTGGGGEGVNITIYITAGISDLMDEEYFAQMVSKYAVKELRRQRGVGVI